MQILPNNGAHCFAEGEGLFVSYFAGRAHSADIEAMHQALNRYHREHAQPLRLLTIVTRGSTLGDRGRKRISTMMNDMSGRVDAWAIVIEGKDLWSTTARAITATIRLLSRTSYPLKVFAEVADGSAWLEQQTKQAMPSTLAETIGSMRARTEPPLVKSRRA